MQIFSFQAHKLKCWLFFLLSHIVTYASYWQKWQCLCIWERKSAWFRILMITTCWVSPPGPLQHATNPSANNYKHKQEETDSETLSQDVWHAVPFPYCSLPFPLISFFQSVLRSRFPSNVSLRHLFLQFPQPPHDVRHISNTASSYLWNGGCKNISVSRIVWHICSNDTLNPTRRHTGNQRLN